MSKLVKGIQLRLSCYKCGGTEFENSKLNYNVIEDMYFINTDKKQKVKCVNCGLEDYVDNLVPRAEYVEYLKEKLI